MNLHDDGLECVESRNIVGESDRVVTVVLVIRFFAASNFCICFPIFQ